MLHYRTASSAIGTGIPSNSRNYVNVLDRPAGCSDRTSAFYKATGGRNNRMEPGFVDCIGKPVPVANIYRRPVPCGKRDVDPIDVHKRVMRQIARSRSEDNEGEQKRTDLLRSNTEQYNHYLQSRLPMYTTHNAEYGNSTTIGKSLIPAGLQICGYPDNLYDVTLQ